MSTDTVEPDAPEPSVPPKPDGAPAVPAQAGEPAAEALPTPEVKAEIKAETEAETTLGTTAEAEAGTGAETATEAGDAAPADAVPAAAEAVPTAEADPAGEALPGLAPAPAFAPAPKRRLSTPALLLAAALLGPVIGTGIGYAIQASREPTPLPELAAVKPAYPANRVDPAALAAAGPKPLNIDGDLRDLLLKRPDGTKEWAENGGSGGWMDIADMAETVGGSDSRFRQLLQKGFRRAAVVTWKTDDKTEVRIRLVQFRSDSAASAVDYAQYLGPGESGKVPGNPRSKLVVGTNPEHYAESTEEYYYGAAMARKGDLVMEVEIYAPGKVDRAQLEDIAKRQWERIA